MPDPANRYGIEYLKGLFRQSLGLGEGLDCGPTHGSGGGHSSVGASPVGWPGVSPGFWAAIGGETPPALAGGDACVTVCPRPYGGRRKVPMGLVPGHSFG